MTTAYDWIVDLPDHTALQILDTVGCIPAGRRQPTAQALLEAIVRLWHGLYGEEVTLTSIAGETDLPSRTVTEIQRLIATRSKQLMPDDPQPPQPEKPTWLQHIGTAGLLDLIASLANDPAPDEATLLPALEEYVARSGFHQGLFDLMEAEAEVLNDLHTVLNRIWQRYFEDHKERTIPF